MKISVYDTYVKRPDGLRMHFDILVPSDLSNQETVLKFGKTYLAAKALPISMELTAPSTRPFPTCLQAKESNISKPNAKN